MPGSLRLLHPLLERASPAAGVAALCGAVVTAHLVLLQLTEQGCGSTGSWMDSFCRSWRLRIRGPGGAAGWHPDCPAASEGCSPTHLSWAVPPGPRRAPCLGLSLLNPATLGGQRRLLPSCSL